MSIIYSNAGSYNGIRRADIVNMGGSDGLKHAGKFEFAEVSVFQCNNHQSVSRYSFLYYNRQSPVLRVHVIPITVNAVLRSSRRLAGSKRCLTIEVNDNRDERTIEYQVGFAEIAEAKFYLFVRGCGIAPHCYNEQRFVLQRRRNGGTNWYDGLGGRMARAPANGGGGGIATIPVARRSMRHERLE